VLGCMAAGGWNGVGAAGPGLSCLVALSSFGCGFFNYHMICAMEVAMRRGPNGIVWAIVQSGLIFPFLMGISLFGVAATPLRLAGFFLIVGSVFLYGIGKRDGAAPAAEPEPGVVPEVPPVSGGTGRFWYLFALLGMLLCGTNQCMGNLPSYWAGAENLGSVYRSLWMYAGVVGGWTLTALVGGKLRRLRLRDERPRLLAFFAVSLSTVGILAAYFLTYPALDLLAEAGVGAIGYPLMVCSCILGFGIYTMLALREKPGALQLLGGLAGLAGIVVICW